MTSTSRPFFDFCRTRVAFIERLDPRENFYEAIVPVWAVLDALADAIEPRVQAATARAEKLPHAILAKAFAGELVPTEAELARAEGRTYETAEELLKRVNGAATTNGVAETKSNGAKGKIAKRTARDSSARTRSA